MDVLLFQLAKLLVGGIIIGGTRQGMDLLTINVRATQKSVQFGISFADMASDVIIGNGIKEKKVKTIFHKATIYIVRLRKEDIFGSSGPCVDCLQAIKKVGIKKMVYSEDKDTINIIKPSQYNIFHETLGTRILKQ